jgi:hypothetical protein
MKTILVPTEDNSAMQSALETALLMARRCDSYIEGFALRWSVAQFAAFAPTGGIPLETDKLAADRMEKQAPASGPLSALFAAVFVSLYVQRVRELCV